MRRQTAWLLLLLLLLTPQALPAGEHAPAPGQAIDFARLLPPPPAPGSARQREDLAAVLDRQRRRTPEMEALAQADAKRSVLRFAPALGPGFTAENLPLALPFFEKLKETADAMFGDAKEHWNRPRPSQADPEVKPCLKVPRGASYPSGHAFFATVTAIALAEMVPQRREEIFERAREYGENRVIGGVHYPSDIAAGRIAGTVVAAALLEDGDFVRELDAAGDEVRRALGLGPRDWPGPGVAAPGPATHGRQSRGVN